MNKKILAIFGILLFEFSCYSAKNQLTKVGVTDYFNPLKNWSGENWYYGRSSVLVEDKLDLERYEHSNIWDDDLSTAWVEGVVGNGIGEWVIVNVDGDYQFFDYENYILDKNFKIKLNIYNGYCKNEKTFYNNSRVKKAKITIYEVPLFTGQHKTYALEEPYVMCENEIELQDSMEEQIFEFTSNPKAPYLEGLFYLYAQLTILDVYPGEKYQDTCISEMKANADVIKENEKNKTSPKKVSEKKSNTIKNLIEKVANKNSEPKVSKKERIQLEQQKALIKEQEAKYIATKEDELYKTITQEELDDFNKDHYIKFYIGENEDYYWFWELYKSVARLCCKPLKNVGTTSPVLRGKLKNYHKEEMEVKMYGYVERGDDYELGPGPYVRAEVMKTLDPLWATSLYFNNHFFLENLEFVQDGKVLYTFTDKEIRNIQRADTFGLKNGGYR